MVSLYSEQLPNCSECMKDSTARKATGMGDEHPIYSSQGNLTSERETRDGPVSTGPTGVGEDLGGEESPGSEATEYGRSLR